nr:electron transport complex subunit RsxA [bacterium]
MEYFALIISAIFVKNILLMKYLGNCPFLGVSKKMDTALGMSMAVIFVMTMATVITWFLWGYFLTPLNLEYLRTIVFILVIAALVQFVEMFIKKSSRDLYQALGIFLPLITTNCAVLGVAIISVQEEYNFPQMLVFAIASAVGYSLALILFAGIRERFEISRIPKSLAGTAIGLVTAGLMSLAFFSFFGMG